MKILKEELFRWVCERHATNDRLDRQMLREKALELAKTFGIIDFKCTKRWTTSFLKEYCIATDPANLSQLDPVFRNYRNWIDTMRSTIIKYKHRDLFHVDELSMYSDVLPSRISTSGRAGNDVDSDGTPRNRITVLIGCNSSGSTKLPLLVCGSYSSRTTVKEHVYSHSEDSSISDELFRGWLADLNDRMSRENRNILLFLRRSRNQALRDFPLSNVSLAYLPNDFPPMLRPLRKDVFHYVKMIFRRRYAERLKRHTSEWNLRDILKSLIEAWETLPREIVVCSFQRTHFRTDDSFLQIDCDCWTALDTGISFRRFVTFDDNLSDEPRPSKNTARYHSYNLRANRDMVQICENSADLISDEFDQAEETGSKESLGVTALRDQEQRGPLADRTFGETEFAERRGASRKAPANIKNTFVSRDVAVSFGGGETFKQDPLLVHRQQIASSNLEGSVQAIIDKALTLTTTAKNDYAKKLISNIYAYNRAERRSANNDPSRKRDKVNEGPQASSESNRPSSSASCCDVFEKVARESSEKICSLEAITRTTEDRAEETLVQLSKDGQHTTEFASKKRRKSCGMSDSEDDSDRSASDKKKPRVDSNWSKEFETNFVFGGQNAVNCCSGHERDENTVVSCTMNTTPERLASPRN
ncbi:tigger transposable element-derived protein 4 isoform X1 [Megalopta genalis]|uniref:tigger transposable element-derived protein 4 isoform X1 n=2 Tax=Megalopta genalis TaxID=115081 RepID=UPI003FD097CB